MGVDLLHQEPARTMGNPFSAYVPGEVTQVSRMTDLHPKFLDKLPGYRGSRLSAPGTRLNRGGPIYSHVSGEVTQVSKMTDLLPKFLGK